MKITDAMVAAVYEHLPLCARWALSVDQLRGALEAGLGDVPDVTPVQFELALYQELYKQKAMAFADYVDEMEPPIPIEDLP